MALIVQKYGGSSLENVEKIKNVARRVAQAKEKGHQLVVVVSAMKDRTNQLLGRAYNLNANPDKRELDALLSIGEFESCLLLEMALKSLGYNAIGLSGLEAGIRTDANYGKARILDIIPGRIMGELEKGKIVVVAGFQGATEVAGGWMDITTLGRGGSDITAVALAARLAAERCEIYHDVDGIYTADPHLVPEARKLNNVGYEEILELSSCGSKVIHPRAVELGELHKIPILVASSFNENTGTLIS